MLTPKHASGSLRSWCLAASDDRIFASASFDRRIAFNRHAINRSRDHIQRLRQSARCMEARLRFRNIPVFVSRRAAGRRASISGAKRIPTVPCRPDGCHSCPAPRGLCCAEPAEPERADDQSGPARDVRFLPVGNREHTTIPNATGSIITDRVHLWWTADRPRADRAAAH